MRKKLVGAFVVVVVLILIGVISVFLSQGIRQAQQKSAAQTTSEEFIDYISNAKPDEAYALLTDEAKMNSNKFLWGSSVAKYGVYLSESKIQEPTFVTDSEKIVATYPVILRDDTKAEITLHLKSQDKDSPLKVNYVLIRSVE